MPGRMQNPDSIRISASFDDREFTLSVIDDGSGFVEKAASGEADGHYGLVGMRERMHRIGGTLVIHSESGGGTQVVMKLQQATAKADARSRS